MLQSQCTEGVRIANIAPEVLTEESLDEGVRYLCGKDPDLAQIFDSFGMPPLWSRDPNFSGLLQIILGQQISLAAADATYGRLLRAIEEVTPERFMKLDKAALKTVGFSRQKARYSLHLAEMIMNGELDLPALGKQEDESVRTQLMRVKGIGKWSADIYLLMALKRPNAWPAGDLALAVAIKEIKGLPQAPDVTEVENMAELWRPWRGVAAQLLWHYYLNRKLKSSE